MTSQVLALRGHLIVEQVTCAVMEATGDYWDRFTTSSRTLGSR